MEWLAQTTIGQKVELFVGALLLVVLVGEGWLLLQIMTQQGRLLLRIEALETRLGVAAPAQARAMGLAVGTPAPTFNLSGLYGETITLGALRSSGKPLVLIFTDPGCGPCTALLPEATKWQRDHAAKINVALISRGTAEANRAKVTDSGVTNVLLQKDREIAQVYQAHGTPSGVLVRQDGTIGSPVAQGADAIRALIATTVTAHKNRSRPAQLRDRLPVSRLESPRQTFSLPRSRRQENQAL